MQNNNFKLICGGKQQGEQERKKQKQESVSNHIKNKRMVHCMQKLREIGTQLDDMNWGTDFVDEDILDRYVKGLRQ